MIELNAGGTILDIEDVSFNITLNSPINSDTGSFVYSYTIPYTVTNAHAFGFPFQLTGINLVESKKDGFITSDGILIKKGIWFAKSNNGKTISIEMYIAASIFYESINEVMLPDLFDLEIEHEDILQHIREQIPLSFPQVNHNWPLIYNPGFYGNINDTVNPQFQGILNDWEIDDLYVTTENNNSICPQLYLGFILKRIFESNGYIVSGNVLTHPVFNQAMLYNNFALDKLIPTRFSGEMSNKYPIYQNNILIWDENISDPGNHYDISTGFYLVDKQGNYQINILLNHEPGIFPTTAEEALLEIYYDNVVIHSFQLPYPFGTHTDFTFIHSYVQEILQADIGSDLYCKFMYLDINGDPIECHVIEGNISILNQDAVENNTFDNVINYSNHVPNQEVKKFLENVFSSAKILPFFDDKFRMVNLVFIDDHLASNRQSDFSNGIHKDSLLIKSNQYSGAKYRWIFEGPDDNLNNNFIDKSKFTIIGTVVKYIELPRVDPGEGHIYFVITLNCFYIWALIDPDLNTFDWIPYSDNLYDYVIDEGKTVIPSNLPPMLMRASNTVRKIGVDKIRNLPSVNAKGTSTAYGLQNDFPLRIMFWHGIEETDSDQFPIATTTMFSTEGNQIKPYNWTWEEIHSHFLTNYSAWLKRRMEVEFIKEVSPAEFANFTFDLKGNMEGALIVFLQLFANLDKNKIQEIKFKGWTK